ncbi:MAG: fused MFS/spermidine synthase [Acidobacteria bacterium]|nr:fused MFS/spermidine synthase [Acidobacteriota bacterium]
MIIVFGISMFLSAALLFLVEPMLAKMMLPLLGGTPAVWNSCLVFFQAMLLVGYLYAHASIRLKLWRSKIAIHCGVIALPLLIPGLLPVHLNYGSEPPIGGTPVYWLFGVLLLSVGLPFFVLSSTSPVMQGWFAGSKHTGARDPYFLYAASNAGSLAGLIAYPFLLEPMLSIPRQCQIWTYGYFAFAVLISICAILVWKGNPKPSENEVRSIEVNEAEIPWSQRLRWIVLAFVPSSLMLGVTTALTTDVPSMPLFWITPLSLYLVSLVLVFSKKTVLSHNRISQWLPAFILVGLLPVVSRLRLPLVPLLVIYLSAFFVVAMFCHGELAASRPPAGKLTEFYLLMSFGGVLGSAFNSLIAPVVFHSAVEFPVVLVLAALLRRGTESSTALWARKDLILPACLGLTMLAVIEGSNYLNLKFGGLLVFLFFAYAALWCFSFRHGKIRFSLGLIAFLLAGGQYTGAFGHVLKAERDFFGVVHVTNDPSGQYRLMIHSGTNHGLQSLEPSREREPLSYYTKQGPAGQIFNAMNDRLNGKAVAVVGLGAGSMACLPSSQESFTFYEIDPIVVRFAEDTRFFTFLHQCAPRARIIMGDARLKLRDAPDSSYRLIALDAFSGDSIPIHLLTREAMELYLRKLEPGGVLAFHISNLYVDLEPSLSNLCHEEHLVGYIERDTSITEQEMAHGKAPSVWVVMSRNVSDLSGLVDGSDSPWKPLSGRSGSKTWTDDYSNLLSVIHWH